MLFLSALAASSRVLASGLSLGRRKRIVPSVSTAKQPPNFSNRDTISSARFTASPPKMLVPRIVAALGFGHNVGNENIASVYAGIRPFFHFLFPRSRYIWGTRKRESIPVRVALPANP